MTEQQNDLELKNAESSDAGPVTCLGMTFENDEDRRAHFTEELRKKLKDPEFRKIEGFPIGEDEDILALSDPPYYTACPNPWVADFIEEWEAEKPEKPQGHQYHREPFSADVSEGKTDPLYRAHSYHTKVPHQAIMRYILHYTEPGDIVFDGFCGTGMAGIAAQMCGDAKSIRALDLRVNSDNEVIVANAKSDASGKDSVFAKVGKRYAVCNDLAPSATFIAARYNLPFPASEYSNQVSKILEELYSEIGWMYETKHSDGTTALINYTVWSEVFSCHECAGEIVFLKEAFCFDSYKVKKEFPCPHCGSMCEKSSLDIIFINQNDSASGGVRKTPKRVPFLINYSVGSKTFEKTPDQKDHELVDRIGSMDGKMLVPTDKLPPMHMANVGRMKTTKVKHIHDFFLPRQAQALERLWQKAHEVENKNLRDAVLWTIEQAIPGLSVLNRYQPIMHGKPGGSQVNRQMAGVFYVPSQISECSPWYNLEGKFKRIAKAFSKICFDNSFGCISTGDCSSTTIPNDSVDYIFTDPPFGENIYYSDLNFLIESWHRVKTNPQNEAIVDRVKKKTLPDYQSLMQDCFCECFRILKPGRWITVEFSNTKSVVWNAIQSALANGGFIVSGVTALDKKQGTFQAINSPTAVKKDLIISAYKPNGGLEKRLENEASSEQGVWDFVRTHMKFLPVTKHQQTVLIFVPERDPRMLYDQMVAFFVRRGYSVPISSREFQIGLGQRFVERDGMYFLPDQAAEYDQKKVVAGELVQASLFVSDEASAIQWLRQVLKLKPQAFSDLNPQFMQQLGGWRKNEAQLDLRELLNQNFLVYDGKGPVPEQIHGYLSSNWRSLRNLPKDAAELVAKAKDRWYVPDPSKAGDLEKLRERALLREFETYVQRSNKFSVRDKFRLEALRAGFKKAWQNRDYALILDVAAKIPDKILEEDQKLLMWRDNAQTRLGDD